MKPQQSDAIPVISTKTRTTLKSLMQDIGNLPLDIEKDVEEGAVTQVGPMIFVYRGADGNPDTVFELEIAQPVESTQTYKGKFDASSLEPITYIERRFTGSFVDIGSKGYEPLINDILKAGHAMAGQCREVYTHWVNPESDENITELQIAIA
ncbi:hypothetical protein A9Q99_15290 [Gammaproteobacteria bacterium 45_16_T64]|nr:hypothetical protein A9Q99_15290 [Gammaproteobacteria bacterium 45_16_T64]